MSKGKHSDQLRQMSKIAKDETQEYHCAECSNEWVGAKDSVCPECGSSD